MSQAGGIASAMMQAAEDGLADGVPEYEVALGVKRLQRGDPVYFCFCNMAQFKHYRLGFDRMFFIKQVSDEAARVQQAAIDAQQAAVAAIRPGVTAESVAQAADGVYRQHGVKTGYRTGWSIGMSYLEAPELKAGDRTRSSFACPLIRCYRYS